MTRMMPRFSARHAPVLFALLMSCVMAFIVTCFVTLINTGFDSGFPSRWMRAFLFAWPVACTCILLFVNRVRRIVAVLTAH